MSRVGDDYHSGFHSGLFAIQFHMSRNRVIGVINYPKENDNFSYFSTWPIKWVVRGRKASHSILRP